MQKTLAILACHYLHCPGLGWLGVEEVEREREREEEAAYSFSACQIAINMYRNDVPRKLASANAGRWHVACGMQHVQKEERIKKAAADKGLRHRPLTGLVRELQGVCGAQALFVWGSVANIVRRRVPVDAVDVAATAAAAVLTLDSTGAN